VHIRRDAAGLPFATSSGVAKKKPTGFAGGLW
jgi:hypothetical protein